MGVELETEEAGPGAPADVRSFLLADVRGYTSFTREGATPRRSGWRPASRLWRPTPSQPARAR